MNQIDYGERQSREEQLGTTNDYHGGQTQRGDGLDLRYQHSYSQGNNTTGGSNSETAPVGPPAARDDGKMSDRQMLSGVTSINKKIDGINSQIDNIKYKIAKHLSDTHQTAEADEAIENEFAKIMSGHKTVVQDFRQLKFEFERQHSQLKQVETNLNHTMTRFHECRSDYMAKTKGQRMRQLQLVLPNADETELDQMAEHGIPKNMMLTAIKNNHRNATAQYALSNVIDRHEQIAYIEGQVREVSKIMAQLNTMVEEQTFTVQKVGENTVETKENLRQGNDHVDIALTSARGTRKKKWICLGICATIIIAIIIIVLIYIFVIKGTTGNPGNKSSKRELHDLTSTVVPRVISYVTQSESRESSIDKELASQMDRISRLRFYFRRMPHN